MDKQQVAKARAIFGSLLSYTGERKEAWNKYIRQPPSPKQIAFLMLPHREALYGGAAGGGKSSALLMGALQHVEVPYYSAIIFRKHLTDLKRKEGLLDRAMEWLRPWIGIDIEYIASTHTFKWWPQESTLTFGYIGSQTAWEHYQGGAYSFVGFDELTQHTQLNYDEMISRNRRNMCNEHEGRVIDGKPAPLPYNSSCESCVRYAPISQVPLRMRSTANPGGSGGPWVKKRFGLTKRSILDERGRQTREYEWFGANPRRPFIPSFYTDNPGLDQKHYGETLDNIADEERRAQLKKGDWGVVSGGRFKPEWFDGRYKLQGDYRLILKQDELGDYQTHRAYHVSEIRHFCVVDIACSQRTGVATQGFYMVNGQPLDPSWTVIGVWGISPKSELLLMHVERFQEESPEIYDALRKTCQQWPLMFVAMEVNGPGKPIAQLALQQGVPVKEVLTFTDKIANCAEAQTRFRSGLVYFPDHETAWADDYFSEMTTWKGLKGEVDDQVDMTSNACHEFSRMCGNLDSFGSYQLHRKEAPQTSSYNRETLFYPDGLETLGYM